MIAAYVCGALVVVPVLGLARGWGLADGDKTKKAGPPVSNEHRTKLHEAANEWVKEFNSLLNPDWAVRVVETDSLDSDEGLTALRSHFQDLNNDYSSWKAANGALRGVPTTPWSVLGRNGQKPTTEQGEAALKEHNDLVRAIVEDLAKIQGQTSITGQCGQCEKSQKVKGSARHPSG